MDGIRKQTVDLFVDVGGENWQDDLAMGGAVVIVFLLIVIALIVVYLSFKR